jgi:hypothetical protein
MLSIHDLNIDVPLTVFIDIAIIIIRTLFSDPHLDFTSLPSNLKGDVFSFLQESFL